MTTIADAVSRAFGEDFPSGPLGDEFYQQACEQTGWLERFAENLPGDPSVKIVGLFVVGRLLEHRWALSPKELNYVEGMRLPFPQSVDLSGRLRLRAVAARRVGERSHADRPPWSEVGWIASDLLPKEYWTEARLEDALEKASAAQRQGAHYRILFPTVQMREGRVLNEAGRLVWAEITVCPPLDRERTSGARLLLAPWTFFLPDSEPKTEGKGGSSWKELCEAFPDALTHLRPCSTEPRDYLVSLHPVGPEDFPCGEPRQRFVAATSLAPHGVKIGGPSLGVAVALAAHAAAMNRRVRPVIATGRIQGDEMVLGVDGTRQKLRAWHLFREGLELENGPLFLYPWQNDTGVREEARDLGLDEALQSRILFPLKSLADLKPDEEAKRDFFTDGFDGYRAWFLKQEPREELAEQCSDMSSVLTPLYSRIRDWKPDAATAEWQSRRDPPTNEDAAVAPYLYEYDLRMMFSLNDVSGIPSEGKSGIIVADVNNVLHFRIFDSGGKNVVDTDESQVPAQKSPIKELRAQLQELRPPHELSASEKRQIITKVTSIVGHIHLYKLTAWFNEEPSGLADEVWRRMRESWSPRIRMQPETSYRDPVVVCVCVDDLLTERGWPDDWVLPGRLARAMQARCGGSRPGEAGPLPSAADFAAALRRPGKLILILYDLKSLDLWGKIDENRAGLMRCLNRLAAPRPDKDVKQQHVVLVFSDLHHQMWFEKGCLRP